MSDLNTTIFSQLRKAETVDEAVQLMADRHWLRLEQNPPAPQTKAVDLMVSMSDAAAGKAAELLSGIVIGDTYDFAVVERSPRSNRAGGYLVGELYKDMKLALKFNEGWSMEDSPEGPRAKRRGKAKLRGGHAWLDVSFDMSPQEIHDEWRDLCAANGDIPHPLGPLVKELIASRTTDPRFSPIVTPRNNRLGVLPSLQKAETGCLPDVDGYSQPSSGTLPLFATTSKVPLWLHGAYVKAGLQNNSAAPIGLHLLIEALTSLEVAYRDDEWHRIGFPVTPIRGRGDLPLSILERLYPSGGNADRLRKDLPNVIEEMLTKLGWIKVNDDYRVAIVLPTMVPRKFAPGDIVELSVRIPRGAAHGAPIDMARLRSYRSKAVNYRAFLSVTAWLDRSARHGQPITPTIPSKVRDQHGNPKRKRGGGFVRSRVEREANPAITFSEPLSDGDLAEFIGLDPAERKYRGTARAAIERLAADGVISVMPERDGIRILGPDPAAQT